MIAPLFDIHLEKTLSEFSLDYDLSTDARCVGVFGPSGAGKTTVLECIAGWRAPDAGHIRIAGRTLFDSKAGVHVHARQRGIGYVPQDTLLFPHWNVYENVTAGVRAEEASASGMSAAGDELTGRVLEFLGLGALRDRPVGELSGGERRRVALARALCSQPALLLLDEPLSSLDPPLRRSILGDLVRVREEFATPILLISHDVTEVQVLCDLAQRLLEGRVSDEGAPQAILNVSTPGDVRENHENILRGRILQTRDGVASVEVGSGVELWMDGSGLGRGDRVIVGVRADEVLIALEKPVGLSARNILPGRIEAVLAGEHTVGVRVPLDPADPATGADAPTIDVNVTPGAAAELRLAPDQPVHIVIKSRSVNLITRL